MAYGKIKADTLTFHNTNTNADENIIISTLGPARTDAEIDGRISNAVTAQVVQGFDADNAVTDAAQTFTAPQRGTVTEYDGATLTPTANAFSIDLSTSNNFLLKPSATYTIALTGLTGTKGQTIGGSAIKGAAASGLYGFGDGLDHLSCSR